MSHADRNDPGDGRTPRDPRLPAAATNAITGDEPRLGGPDAPIRRVWMIRPIHWNYNDEYWYPMSREEAAALAAGYADEMGEEAFAELSTEAVAAYTDPAKAEARRRELEAEARSERLEFNPFEFTENAVSAEPELTAWTSLPEAEFRRRLAESGVTPPDGNDAGEWFEAIYEVWDSLTEAQRGAIWGLMDQVRFYQVVECDAEVGPDGVPHV